jgi:hypothetical protein
VRRRTPPRRHIAPRLASGEKRIPAGNGLPPLLKFCLRDIAERENRSLSWVIESILIDWAREDPRLHKQLRGDALAYRAPARDRDEVEAAVATVARRVRQERNS